MRRPPLLLAPTAALLLAGIARAGTARTYVERSREIAMMLQIIETGHHELAGHIEQIKRDGGKVSTTNLPVSGAIDGRTVVLKVGGNSASGSMTSGSLHIIGGGGGGSFDVTMVRGNMATFQTDAADIEATAARVRGLRAFQAKTKAFQGRMSKSLGQMAHYEKVFIAFGHLLPERMKQLTAIDDRYRRITAWMASALHRERALFGGPAADADRSRISVAETNARVQADELHTSIETHLDGVTDWDKANLPKINGLDQECRQALGASGAKDIRRLDRMSNQMSVMAGAPHIASDEQSLLESDRITVHSARSTFKRFQVACKTFEDRLPEFQKDMAADHGLYDAQEKVWRRQNAEQKRIETQAQRAAG